MAENRGTMGGFAAVNKPEGIIENCYCEGKTKKLSGNFAVTRKGKATDCYCHSKQRRAGKKRSFLPA